MVKQKVTILLIGLMCFSSVSSLFIVICRGSGDHIAVEPIVHNHCECPESGENGNQNNFTWSAIGRSTEHEHCKDSTATSNVVILVRKNINPQLAKVSVQGLYQKSISNHTISSFRHPLLRNAELSSFFAPLRTVILLA